MFARACELLFEGPPEFAPANLRLLNTQDTEADPHVERVAHESKGLVAHGATLAVVDHRRQRHVTDDRG
jgi:hypothetical protein